MATAVGSLDVLEFFRFTDVMLLRFYRLPKSVEHMDERSCVPQTRHKLLHIVKSSWFNILSIVIILLSAVVLCMLMGVPDLSEQWVSVFEVLARGVRTCAHTGA